MSISRPRRTTTGFSNLPALSAMAVAMVSVQTGASLAKQLFYSIGASGTTALRGGMAAVILAALLRPWRDPPAKRAWPALGAYGVSLGVMNLLFYSALQRIPLGVAVAVEFIGPMGVALVSSRRSTHFLWVALALAGLLAHQPRWKPAPTLDVSGVLLAVGGGLYIVFGRMAGTRHGAQATAVGLIVAAAVVVPVGVVQAGTALLAPAILPTALGVAILSSVLPYSLEMFALTRIPVRVFGTLMSAEPAIAALLGLLLLRETLSPRQWLAIGLIMAASLGTTIGMGPGQPRDAALAAAAD